MSQSQVFFLYLSAFAWAPVYKTAISNAEVCGMQAREWKWFHYYWNLCELLGQETYRTWRWELFASVILGYFLALLTGGWKDFKTALLATGLTLGLFAVWHLMRVPWLLHTSAHGSGESGKPGVLAGVFGMLIIVGVFTGGYELAIWMWRLRPLGTLEAQLKSPLVPTVVVANAATSKESACLPTTVAKPQACTIVNQGTMPQDQLARVVQINANLAKGDRDHLADALFELSQVLDEANVAWGKANRLKLMNMAHSQKT